jgi:hypothetical protein
MDGPDGDAKAAKTDQSPTFPHHTRTAPSGHHLQMQPLRQSPPFLAQLHSAPLFPFFHFAISPPRPPFSDSRLTTTTTTSATTTAPDPSFAHQFSVRRPGHQNKERRGDLIRHSASGASHAGTQSVPYLMYLCTTHHSRYFVVEPRIPSPGPSSLTIRQDLIDQPN